VRVASAQVRCNAQGSIDVRFAGFDVDGVTSRYLALFVDPEA
jgi:hypothetical protein